MSLSDVYADLDDSATPFPTCKTCQWYVALDPDDKTFFDNKANNPEVNMRKLLRACKAHSPDLVVSDSSFRNHVRDHHAMLLEHLS